MKDLGRLVRRVAVELRSTTTTYISPESFLKAFYEEHGDDLTDEQIRHGFEIYLYKLAKAAMQKVETEMEGMMQGRQLMLPMTMQHIKLPQAFPISRAGKQVIVPAVVATLEDCDSYTAGLQENIQDCMVKFSEWSTVWKPVREIMVANPGMDFGAALELLAGKEKAAKPAKSRRTAEPAQAAML